MFENGFPREWSTIKKLALLFRAVVNAIAPVLKTVTGAIIHITDALARPAQSLKVNFNPVQSGSGDPSPDNIRPISGWTECKVTMTGKNIFGAAENGSVSESVAAKTPYTTVLSGTVPNRRRNASPIFVNGKAFTISCSSDYSVCVCLFDKNLLYLGLSSGFESWAKSITVNNPNAYYICVVYKKDDNSDLDAASDALACVQVEIGSTATAYEAYQGQTHTIDLDGTRYGGTLDVTTGKLTLDRVFYEFDGTENWVRSGTYNGSFYLNTGNQHIGNDDEKPSICSHAKFLSLFPANYSYGYFGFDGALRDNVNIWLVQPDTTLADFKAYLANQKAANTPVQIVGYIATPIEVQLTPAEITLFAGENNLWSNANGTLELTYLADGNTSEIEALNILLGGQYSNNHGEDEPTDREALNILLGGNER